MLSLNFWNLIVITWMGKPWGNNPKMSELTPESHSDYCVNLSISTTACQEYTEKANAFPPKRKIT